MTVVDAGWFGGGAGKKIALFTIDAEFERNNQSTESISLRIRGNPQLKGRILICLTSSVE